jgi:2-keto-4-pentenoate hydratase/2-oxohepta-3-ene-1,7-dioic acid hydratase in catechol pathway
MRLCRFDDQGIIRFGRIEDDRVFATSAVSLLEPLTEVVGEYRLEEVRLLSPVVPGKIVCVGRNYADHAKEMGNDLPKEPILFIKPPSAVVGPEDSIELPPESERVDHEGELAIVIGKRGRRIAASAWRDHVLGFTCANDVTARDLQKRDIQFTRGKSFDTFAPLGPWIETDLDVADLSISTRVGGVVRQDGRASQMIFPPAELVAFISAVMTLEPGDVILTGTPAGVGPLQSGDLVEVEIGGIGVLRNHVRRG